MLTESDLALVHALQEAPRASWATLATHLATDARTLARRYSRLTDAGRLRVMATAGPRLLARTLFVHLRVRAVPGCAADVAEQLAHWPQATTVRLTDGSHDIHALLVGADHPSLIHAAHGILATLDAVARAELTTVLQAGDVGRAARLDALSRQQVTNLRGSRTLNPTAAPMSRLGPDDFDLIHALHHDGRSEATEVAARLDRDPSTVSRRITRLQRDGFIDIVALTPDSSSSAPVRALLWCTIAPQDLSALIHKVARLPWVGLLTVTTGNANLVLVANLTTRSLLPTVQAELADLCPSLRLRETQLSTRAVKLHMRWMTREDRLTDDIADPFSDLRHELVGA